jgi:hypothetical protein
MAYAGTPIVHNQLLLLPGDTATTPRRIRLGTAAWWAWLETATAFSYRPLHSHYALTVRKEKRRHGCYWYAYLKVDSKLHNAYLGRSQALTPERLNQVLQTLLEKSRRQRTALTGKGA